MLSVGRLPHTCEDKTQNRRRSRLSLTFCYAIRRSLFPGLSRARSGVRFLAQNISLLKVEERGLGNYRPFRCSKQRIRSLSRYGPIPSIGPSLKGPSSVPLNLRVHFLRPLLLITGVSMSSFSLPDMLGLAFLRAILKKKVCYRSLRCL